MEKKKLYLEVIKRSELMRSSFPWHDGVFIEIGKMLMRLGQGGKAGPVLQHASKLNQKSPKPLGLMSDLFVEKGEYKKAIRFAKQAAELSGSPRAYSKLGELELRGGALNDAIKTLSYALMRIESDEKTAEKKDGILAVGYNLRGQAYMEKGESEKSKSFMNHAVKDFEKSSNINPDFLAANYNLMVTYRKIGEKKKALKVLDRIKTMEPQDADGWIHLAEAYFNDDDAAKASFALEKALSYKKGDLAYYKKIADAYIEYGMFDKAEPLLRSASKASPDDVYFYNHLGIIYRRQRKLDKAREQYEKALKLDPDDAKIYFNLGRVYLDSGNTKDAKDMFKKSMEIDPELDAAKHFMEDISSE